jgi:quercetin dioxygenase-like cupin family protein
MATIRIVDEGQLPWFAKAEGEPEHYDEGAERARLVEVSKEGMHDSLRFHHPGSEDELQMLEVRKGPGEETASHAHLADEIIYVLEGELKLGARSIGPGSSVYIPAETLYAFKAGPEGLRFLNFRPKQDLTFLTKEQFMVSRAARKAG